MTLTDFLLARIAEDEAVAERARENLGYLDAHGVLVAGQEVYSPTRVLSDCAARRGLIDACLEAIEMNRPPSATNSEVVWLAEDFLKALAVPHADHPDYREEWKA